MQKGKHHSEETKRRMSLAQMGNKNNLGRLGWHPSEETKRKMSLAKMGNKSNLGRHLSEETKRRMSLAKKGKHYSEEAKRRMSLAKMGWHPSEETKRKISESQKGKPRPEKKGTHHSEETKRKMSEAHRGERSYLWQGGISFEPYSVDWTKTLRRAIRERDHYICQLCSQYGNAVHHIDYNKKNCSPDNLITLCGSCNSKVNSNRKYWEVFFKRWLPGNF